jgi:hypothetical protein
MIKNKAIVNEENTSIEYWKKKYRDLMEKQQSGNQTSAKESTGSCQNMEMEMLSKGQCPESWQKALLR